MEITKIYILKLQTDNTVCENKTELDRILNKETGNGIIAYSFKEIELPKLDEDK